MSNFLFIEKLIKKKTKSWEITASKLYKKNKYFIKFFDLIEGEGKW